MLVKIIGFFFFDEFDAIGKSRETVEEHSELKRVVNSFLQILDGFICDSLVIAATNHEKAIDKALWRRYDEIVMFNKPDCEQITKLIQKKLRAFSVECLDINRFAKELEGCSYADIERVCLSSIKSCLINGNKPITDEVFSENVRMELERANIIKTIGE